MSNIPGVDPRKLKGEWELLDAEFKSAATHTALLRTNKIFIYGGSSLDKDKFPNPPPAEILNLDTMQTRRISMRGVKGDLWCGGHTMLEDGRLLFVGGTSKYLNLPKWFPGIYPGLDTAYIYDPFYDRWEEQKKMHVGRWYPTLIRLADNTVNVVAGFTHSFPYLFLFMQETFRAGSNGGFWGKMKHRKFFPLYPRLHLLNDGDVFYSGVFNVHLEFPQIFPSSRWSYKTKKWKKLGGKHVHKHREEGISLLMALRPGDYYADKILIAGGGHRAFQTATDSVEMIDLSQSDPKWGKKSAMTRDRIHAVGVQLPDGNILVVGGKTGTTKHSHDNHEYDCGNDHDAVRESEMYDPDTDAWTLMAEQHKDRIYHSTAILLPDGKVLSMGSNPEAKCIEKSIEIYSPPYLFWGDRPVIVDPSPEKITYRQTFSLKVDNTRQISQVVLRRLDVITHVTNTDQRLLELTFKVSSNEKLEVDGPLKREHMPQGYCLLFVISNDGVPSEGKFVLVQ